MSEIRNRAAVFAGIAAMAVALVSGSVLAQSGTLLSQTSTVVKSSTDPVLSFRVKDYKGAGTTTLVLLEFGPDGNASLPAPDPALPATARFVLTMAGAGGGTVTLTPPPTGSFSAPGISNKNVAVDRAVESPVEILATPTTPATAGPRGLYRITIGHLTNVSATETWTLTLTNIPAGLRVIASIVQGDFTGLTPPPSPCGGGTCPPCLNACQVGPCPGTIRIEGCREFVFPPVPGPGPGPCPYGLSCPRGWEAPYDSRAFDRIVVTFLPTDAQRATLEKNKDIRFNITGGEPIGDILRGGSGEFMQLVQYPKGKPAEVAVTSAGAQLAQFRATPPSVPGDRTQDLLYGLGGLILGALGTLFGMRRGWGAGRGSAG
jgi:hypothetical protein